MEKVSSRLEGLLRERAEFEEKKQMFYLQQKVMAENASDKERGMSIMKHGIKYIFKTTQGVRYTLKCF